MLLMTVPPAAAFDEPVAGMPYLTAINRGNIPDGCFTTLQKHTFRYGNACRVSCKNPEGRTVRFTAWSCSVSGQYYLIYDLSYFYLSYSDYTIDSKGVVFMQIPHDGRVYGILFDCLNISYAESGLLYGILGMNHLAPTYQDVVYDYSGGSSGGFSSRCSGQVIDPYQLAYSDPSCYYDYFDEEDYVDIDEYIYDEV